MFPTAGGRCIVWILVVVILLEFVYLGALTAIALR